MHSSCVSAWVCATHSVHTRVQLLFGLVRQRQTLLSSSERHDTFCTAVFGVSSAEVSNFELNPNTVVHEDSGLSDEFTGVQHGSSLPNPQEPLLYMISQGSWMVSTTYWMALLDFRMVLLSRTHTHHCCTSLVRLSGWLYLSSGWFSSAKPTRTTAVH